MARRASGLVLAVSAILTVACASGPQPVVTPHTDPIAYVGVNLGPERMTPQYLQLLAASGKWLTLRVPVHSQAEARDVLDAVQPYSTLSVLVLIEKPDLGLVTSVLPVLLKAWPGRLAGIELGNELDLFGLTPQQFGAFVLAGYQQLRQGGYDGDVLSGGIYTVDSDSLDYLSTAANGWPSDVVLGLHWYGDTNVGLLAQVQAFGRRVAITEYGQPSRTPQEDAAQVAYLTAQTAAFQRLGARYALPYQLISGPCGDLSNLANFGLLDCHDLPKPAFAALFH